MPDEVRQILSKQGFQDISISRKDNSQEIIKNWKIGKGTENMVFSAYIKAIKPQKEMDNA